MKNKKTIIDAYETEYLKGYIPEAIDLLLEGLHLFEDDTELINLLIDLRTDYGVLRTFSKEQIETIEALHKKTSSANYSNLMLLVAELSLMHRDPQMTFECLSEALIADPWHDGLLAAIEALNSCVDDAPVFADEMETIAKLVAKGTFPREIFDYLLLALKDPDYPSYFDLAIAIANKR